MAQSMYLKSQYTKLVLMDWILGTCNKPVIVHVWFGNPGIH